MKIFSSVFDLARPSSHKFNVETNSDYAIGVKVVKDGVVQNGTVSLLSGNTALSAESTAVDGFKVFNRTSGNAKSGNKYQVVYVNDGISSFFDLMENVCDTGVFEKGTGSGGGGSYTLPVATQTTLGGVKFNPEYGVKVDGEGFMAMATASKNGLGGVIIGENIAVANDGTISVENYVLPEATNQTIGGVKLGNNISVDTNGALSASETDPAFQSWLSSNTVFIGNPTRSCKGISIAGSALYSSSSEVPSSTLLIGGKQAYGTDQEIVCIGIGSQATARDVVIGSNATSDSVSNGNSVVIGDGAKGKGVIIGYGAQSATNTAGTAIGTTAKTNSNRAIAIGGYATVAANCEDSIVIGNGSTNNTAGTFQVWSFPVLTKSTGLLTPDRMGTGYDATKTQVLKNVNGTLTWVDEA